MELQCNLIEIRMTEVQKMFLPQFWYGSCHVRDSRAGRERARARSRKKFFLVPVQHCKPYMYMYLSQGLGLACWLFVDMCCTCTWQVEKKKKKRTTCAHNTCNAMWNYFISCPEERKKLLAWGPLTRSLDRSRNRAVKKHLSSLEDLGGDLSKTLSFSTIFSVVVRLLFEILVLEVLGKKVLRIHCIAL